jgi:anti-sigma regulatory factor (Ser/Thr protein kinase)
MVADIRRRVGQVAESMPFKEDAVEDIKLAVGEASTNAFRYGCPDGEKSSIQVRAVGDSRSLIVEITDFGPGFEAEDICPPVFGCMEPGGRGIWFMRLTMDKVSFIRQENGTMVRMVKFVKPCKFAGTQT